MKFSNYSKLQEFVKKELFPKSYKDMYEICIGATSYNFCVITSKGKYLLKLLQNRDTYLKIKSLNQSNGTLYKTEIEDFQKYKLLLMPYFDGHKLRYKDFSESLVLRFWQAYQPIGHLNLDKHLIEPRWDNMVQYNRIEQLLKTTRQDIFTRCYYKIIKTMKKDLVSLSFPCQIIHGDLTANNVLVAPKSIPYILDWGSVRYGYPSEDLSSLILQLSGFRTPFGRISRLKKLFSNIDKYAQLSSEEWLYGIQSFYLNLLQRRLSNSAKQSFHKRLSLLLIALGYFRVRSFITNAKC